MFYFYSLCTDVLEADDDVVIITEEDGRDRISQLLFTSILFLVHLNLLVRSYYSERVSCLFTIRIEVRT